jgi:hypothetical protein
MIEPLVYQLITTLAATNWIILFWHWQRAGPMAECVVFEETFDKSIDLSYNHRTLFSK